MMIEGENNEFWYNTANKLLVACEKNFVSFSKSFVVANNSRREQVLTQ